MGLDRNLPKQREPGIPDHQNSRTGAYAQLVADGRDLVDLHALICPRPFLVSGGSEDPVERWVALNHARTVNQILGQKKPRIAMTNRQEHSPDEFSNKVLRSFFVQFLHS